MHVWWVITDDSPCTCLCYCTGAQLEQKQALGIPKHILGQDFCGSGNCAKSKLHSRGKDWKTEGISPVLYQWILCEIHEGGRPLPTWKPVAVNRWSPFFLQVFTFCVLWYFSYCPQSFSGGGLYLKVKWLLWSVYDGLLWSVKNGLLWYMGHTSNWQFHTQWWHFSRQMVTIDYDGFSTKLTIILMIELGIWVIRATGNFIRSGDTFQCWSGLVWSIFW